MAEAQAETERLRQLCRASAYQSTARNGEAAVNAQGQGLEATSSSAKGSTLKAVADCKHTGYDHEVPASQLDSSAFEQAEEHARGRAKEERSKLAQAGLDSLMQTTKEAPQGVSLEVSQPRSVSSDAQLDKQTPKGELANEVYAFISAQEASEMQRASEMAAESLAQATLSGSSPEELQTQEAPTATTTEVDRDNLGTTTAVEIPTATTAAVDIDNLGTSTVAEASSALASSEREQPQESSEREQPQESSEIELPQESSEREQQHESPAPLGENTSSEESSEADLESEESDTWPPSPPMLKFKMRMQFSNRFKPTDPEQKALFETMNQDLEDKLREKMSKKLKDPVLGWMNLVFHMNIDSEYQFEAGFPLILLTMLDAIYPTRVRWREVDWRVQYKRALQKNYAVLEFIWAEVNMEKAREFRVENTSLRLENQPTSNVAEKLEFLRLMKRWYDQRIHHSGPYDPMAKRREFVEQCKAWGHAVKFPVWILYDKDHQAQEPDRSEARKEYDKMPEYKRLIWFLGCQEYQTM
jgi:hypothetical protein